MSQMANSELILNDDGSIYHLHLLPSDIADTVITVGDPKRVEVVSQYFDRIEVRKQKREFITHTGYIGQKRLTVISTGMGPGNIDIFMNELDALANIDFQTRSIKAEKKSLSVIRLGTSGSLHPQLLPGQLVISTRSIGMDTAAAFYIDKKTPGFDEFLIKHQSFGIPNYWASCSQSLNHSFPHQIKRGTTLTAPGFYGAQNRMLRLPYRIKLPFDFMHQFEVDGFPITNMEMETSVIYMFSELMGHRALSINCILANRIHGTFSADPARDVRNMIESMLEYIVAET
jgi:uridine phosphorylase